jgi:predicted GH43/DUF377 family glycosyl hydrolase
MPSTPAPVPEFRTPDAPVLVPREGVPWADTMLLNPAVLDDPATGRLHMLFRATGPWPQARTPGRPLPYPIFLGYAWSEDGGVTWNPDFSRPCLAPALAMEEAAIRIRDRAGNLVVNHANGCIEDPRLFRFEGRVHVTTACRMFPPGPYWEHDEPLQCAPEWARAGRHALGRAATENLTVTVLWEVDLAALVAGRYAEAFRYVAPLTDPELGDNRDAFPFPRRLRIGGRDLCVALHRPFEPACYGGAYAKLQPSIFLSAAPTLEELGGPRAEHRLLAQSLFPWEGNRVGASWVPLELDNGDWLVPYHGKQDAVVGYTQSFLVVTQGQDGWPVGRHRCPDRLQYARKRWELDGRFKTPCVFTCGGVRVGDDLVVTYGAADTVAGVARTDFRALVAHVRTYDADGNRT